MMQKTSSIAEIREIVEEFKSKGLSVAFVPTMGFLHEGHLSLFRLAHEYSDVVVASIYVNPTQFGPDEDYEEYPRDLERDLKLCDEENVSAIFTPVDSDIYPGTSYFSIQIEKLNNYLCGATRKNHFEGVALIVNKLFNIITPDVAVFGQKDIQQFVILEHMVREFNHNIRLIKAPIKRANDGLALSSRNTYLSDNQRKIAPGLYRSLKYIKKQVIDKPDNVELLLEHQKSELEQKGFEIDYLSVVNYEDLSPVTTIEDNSVLIIAGAVYLGDTRLIDNIIVEI